jgi:hypothetical protein
MWDTPGRERFASKRRRQYETTLSDSFFRQADAIMLVYDMTNSTSFTQLLKWYADLMELKKRHKESRGRVLPVMIVANKLDIYQSDQERRKPQNPQHTEQRDVLGLPGDFRGKDFRYEYRVSPVVNAQIATKLSRSGSGDNHRRMEISSFLANRDNWTTDGSYLDSVRTDTDGLALLSALHHCTFYQHVGSWPSFCLCILLIFLYCFLRHIYACILCAMFYLFQQLLNSEEGSHPDLEMVLLWCMRNGLQHYEVSAATGQGVDTAIDALVVLSLESRKKDEEERNVANTNNGKSNNNRNNRNTANNDDNNNNGINDNGIAAASTAAAAIPANATYSYQRNQALDLHQRYAPKEDSCFFLRPAIRWFQKN